MSTSTMVQQALLAGRWADGAARRSIAPLRALGAAAADIATHVHGSPHLRDGRFANIEPAAPAPGGASTSGAIGDMLRSPGRPTRDIMVTRPRFAASPRELAVTWLGHATTLVEIDGRRVLTDPVFSRRCSPSQLVGPARMHRMPCAVSDLPAIDVVLISHDHYDHLDMATVIELCRTQPDAIFVAPIGVGAHLLSWGVPSERIEQADWHGSVAAGGLTFTAIPARHFSGRGLVRNNTLWASFLIGGPTHRVFFSGDTGFTEQYAGAAHRHGAVHLAITAIGAYDPLWPDVHVNPEEAVQVHRMVAGEHGADAVLLPIHWGTFSLARHSWADPVQRLLTSAAAESVTTLVPQPGGDIDVLTRTGAGLSDPTWWERSA